MTHATDARERPRQAVIFAGGRGTRLGHLTYQRPKPMIEFHGRPFLDYLVELESEAVVRALTPDHGRLRTLGTRGVMITSLASTPGWDFVSRFFAPGSGIDEDPVTGSAHCCLTPFWSRRLGRTELVARQVSARGGTLRVKLDGDRVRLRGQAVTVLRGELVD